MEQSIPKVPESHVDLLGQPLIAHVATVRVDGGPQSKPNVIWLGR